MSLGCAFNALWGANSASNLADGLAFVSMPLLAASLTDDPRWVAGLATVYALVRLLAALPVGVWVDRADRRLVLVSANLLRGTAVATLALCVHFGIGGLLLVYAAFAVVGTLESAADNAAVSLVPGLVGPGDLDRANSRISASQLVADEFAGPPLGGLLFALAASAPLFAMGGLWAVAGVLALALPPRAAPDSTAGPDRTAAPDRIAVPGSTVWRDAMAGAHWLVRHRLVGGLALIGALASTGYMLAFSILVLFAQQQLGVDGAGYGIILAVSAAGGLIASYATPRMSAWFGYRWTISAALAIGAGSLLVLAVTHNASAAALLLAAYIFHAVVWGICATSLRQRLVPDGLRGRVNAASRVLGLLGLALGSAAGGALAVVNVALPVAAGGMVFLICAAAAVYLLRNAGAGTGRAGTPPALNRT
ncbi:MULTISPECIES: MFS transporter [unclassified Arthrobacter]|uniref:MFS transporter n=1 Tax=unclassified Arthrobacter TaxID=235627 RepID=UPI001D14E090|nr:MULTISPECIES: MFS transporter [unclassified Arthrobacter]MCC3277059.1 MFS transporter [Arthrobacter sp. zg-Y20]MCC9178869.1 MFS transporter [Arthrobacter sp. zg-Y750]MDK1317220.1 MFS transporter [Arthrobacter sp. zg.Y20]WIB07312.1 MFS transporter [Arthrobacter sp. zg-Y20]